MKQAILAVPVDDAVLRSLKRLDALYGETPADRAAFLLRRSLADLPDEVFQ